MRFGVVCFAFFLSLVSIPTTAEARLKYVTVCSTFEDTKLIVDHTMDVINIDDSGYPAVRAAKIEEGLCVSGGMEFSCGYDPRTDADAVYVREDEDGSFYVLKREQDKDGEKVVRFVTYWDWHPTNLLGPRTEDVLICSTLEDTKLVVDTFADLGEEAGREFFATNMDKGQRCKVELMEYSCEYNPGLDDTLVYSREADYASWFVIKLEQDVNGRKTIQYFTYWRPTEIKF